MGLIQVIDFHKSFGTKQVHKGINIEVKKGECLGLIGGSGTGKSVLLRSLIGLEKADSGKIMFDGVDITQFKERELIEIRKRVAYVFQGGALFDSMTVYENMAYPLRAHTDLAESQISTKIKGLLNEFGLQGNEKLFPANLSGGMQKRLGLARSIIMGPEVVLFDEPTAGLDPYNTKKIQEMILRLKFKGNTAILVTHDMPVAFAVCDRIAMISGGKIGTVSSVSEIKRNNSNMISQFALGEVS